MDDMYLLSSFRDPSGALFYKDGVLYRQINNSYKENYELLCNSGLYDTLIEKGLLISHNEVDIKYQKSANIYKTIKPDLIPFISYPYEWCFSQLKNAALATLDIQKHALTCGMSLKDCSAYNIQFMGSRPVFIDTLSFEKYYEGYPWVAYRQFCKHFLAPLILMSYKDIRLNQLLRIFIDGMPLDLSSSLLPLTSYFSLPIIVHIHFHARSQRHFARKDIKSKDCNLTRFSLLGIIDNLESIIKKTKLRKQNTEWADYYNSTNYSSEAFVHKKKIVAEFLGKTNLKSVWDLGANEGIFSRIASKRGIETISFDIDPIAVEKNYLACLQKKEEHILPLLLNLTNPSPGIGWENQERMSLTERASADAVLALALIHHLAISNNLPFARIASFFSKICKVLIIEFVPKDDSQVKKLLLTREDIFSEYNQEVFERAFGKYFTIKKSVKVTGSERIIYLMHRI